MNKKSNENAKITSKTTKKKSKKTISKAKYKKLVKECLILIQENNILFTSDLIALLPFSKSTFYAYNLDKSEDLKEALEINKSKVKQNLLNKWFESSTPTLQLALYKILATPDEKKAISGKETKTDTDFSEKIQQAYLLNLEKMNDDENEDNINAD